MLKGRVSKFDRTRIATVSSRLLEGVRVMRNSTTMLATIALGALLATGSATASIAGGGGDGGATFIRSRGDFRNHGGFGGGRSFGDHSFNRSNGSFAMHRGFGMRHRFNGDHRFYGRRHFGRFHGGDDLDDFFVPFFGLGQYGPYCGNYRSYGWGVHRYYCP